MRKFAILLAVVGLSAPAGAAAQSLSELAKEKEKEKKPAASPTYTAGDLRKAGGARRRDIPPPRSSPAEADEKKAEGAGAGEGKAEGEEQKTPQQLREEAQTQWQERLTAAEAEVTRLQGLIANLESSLANPGVGTVEQRQSRTQELAKARTDLTAAERNVETLKREGRQGGYRR